ncbi:hypothetical protein UPYG_G00305760 [Umbra pygmaea]|uniref:Uncharacterized protein n=1 Tax=Umbra pygmaea TaxID=75934 RepID=A0ABD0W0F0_UMBPY
MWFYPPRATWLCQRRHPHSTCIFPQPFFLLAPHWSVTVLHEVISALGLEAKHTSPSLATIAGYVTSATCPVGTPWRQRWFPVGRASSLPGVERGSFARWRSWDDVIVRQLSEAHRARFPAVLTARRGVD